MQVTNDYAIFKTILGNRTLNKPHLDKLIKSVKEKNLLQYSPILVNESYEVIDGQHRLEVCKILKLPVYYVMLDPASLRDVQLLNENNKKWQLSDFVDSYAKQKNTNYIILQEYVKKFDLSISTASFLLSGGGNGVTLEKIKSGSFLVTQPKKAENIGNFIKEMRGVECPKPEVIESKWFINAIMITWEYLDKKTLLTRLEKPPFRLTKPETVKEAIRLLEDLLNYNRKKYIVKL